MEIAFREDIASVLKVHAKKSYMWNKKTCLLLKTSKNVSMLVFFLNNSLTIADKFFELQIIFIFKFIELN